MDFYYVAMDFGGHGHSSHHQPGFQYHHQDYVNEVRRVVAALRWNRFSLMGHSFGGFIGGMFSCIFPEMVDKLILLESTPFFLDIKELNNLLSYKRRAIEQVLHVEAQQKPPKVLSREELLQSLLKNNSHLDEECGKLLLDRGTRKVDNGFVLCRDRRLNLPEYNLEFISKEQFTEFCNKIEARLLLIRATKGFSTHKGKDQDDPVFKAFLLENLQSIFKERGQFAEVVGNHYVHMLAPHLVAKIVSDFLESSPDIQAHL